MVGGAISRNPALISPKRDGGYKNAFLKKFRRRVSIADTPSSVSGSFDQTIPDTTVECYVF